MCWRETRCSMGDVTVGANGNILKVCECPVSKSNLPSLVNQEQAHVQVKGWLRRHGQDIWSHVDVAVCIWAQSWKIQMLLYNHACNPKIAWQTLMLSYGAESSFIWMFAKAQDKAWTITNNLHPIWGSPDLKPKDMHEALVIAPTGLAMLGLIPPYTTVNTCKTKWASNLIKLS